MSIALDRYFLYEVEGFLSSDLKYNILRSAYYGDLDQLRDAISEAPNSINSTDKFTGRTAFMIAASLGNYSIVEYLAKQANIDPMAKDFFGNDAFDHAWSSGNSEVLRVIHELIYPNGFNDDDNVSPAKPSGP